MTNEERVFKRTEDFSVGLFQSWIGEGSHDNHLVVDDGEGGRIFMNVDEARGLYEFLRKVLP